MKDIKTKQKYLSIKKKDKQKNIKHYIKQQSIATKPSRNAKEENTSTNANVQATNKISTTAKQTLLETKHRTTKFIKQKREEYRMKSSSIDSSTTINDSSQDTKIQLNDSPIFSSHPTNVIHSTNDHYTYKAKHFVMNKINDSKVKEATNKITSTPILKESKKVIHSTIVFIKQSVTNISTLFSFGTGLILLVVITLFIGTFSVLANDGGSNTEIYSLSEEVLAYEETITKYATQYGIESYVSLIEAIMMQESSGKGSDPMQSSESGHNEKYPRVPNGITDAEYSIEVGVHTFSDCLLKANVTDTSDTEHIYLALQGYNYGSGYIDWAISNFNGYSKYNAQLYSDNKKQELNTSVYGDPEYVDHVMRYVGITFRGGTNPNFNNLEAWITKNPYAQAGLYGQCTWFAWGRFYEIYGYDPGFRGNGWDCVDELLAAHPDKFERSTTPKAGAVFSGIGKNHVGIVIAYDGTNMTIQDGNYDGITNTFEDAKSDWKTVTYTLDEYRIRMGGVVFANPK